MAKDVNKYDVVQVDKVNVWKNLDYLLFIIMIVLSVTGIIILSSAISTKSDSVVQRAMMVQIIGFVVGIGIAVWMSSMDYHLFRQVAIYFYAVNLLVMLMVYSPLGMDIAGSRSWLDLRITTYQPSELMKVATIIMVAICLEDLKTGLHPIRDIIRTGLFFAVPFGLVLLQKDIGTALVFAFFFICMLFVAGLKFRYFAAMGVVGIVSVFFGWTLLNDSRKNRIISFIYPEKDPLGSGYQALQARYAIGSGQLTGKGLGQGPINKGEIIPVKESDFIFTVIGEEWGFIGSCFVILLFLLLLFRVLNVSRKSPDLFGSFVAVGIFGVLAFHFIENIGMNIGMLPITGIPLPFVSQGGSALIANYFALGVVLSISARCRKEKFFE